jgi:hypothetical protein
LTEAVLKLVILRNATENWYSISAHNQTPEEAKRLLEEWNKHLQPGCSLVSLDQRKPHQTEDHPQDCRTCRDVVRRSSGLEPQPKFQRRKS